MSRSVERHWQRANAYLQQGQLPAARAELEALRALAPTDWRGALLAARVAWLEGRPRVAAARAAEAAANVPDRRAVVCDVLDMLLKTGETALAQRLFTRPFQGSLNGADAVARWIDFAHRLGDHSGALAALDSLLVHRPDDGPLHCHRGLQLEYLGHLDEAAEAYARCLALTPAYGHAAYQLSRLHQSAHTDQLLHLIERGLQSAAPGTRDRADLEFAYYHALEDIGQSAAAWQALARANAIMYGFMGSAAKRQLQGLRQFDAWWATHSVCADTPPVPSPCPIFIVGMPRSGTTVLERMLGNHSKVASAGELPDFGQQLMYVADSPSTYSDAFYARLPVLDFTELGRRYVAQTRWRAGDKACFTDKQPGNWMLAGLIHIALPEAKILHLVRDPMDVCFSNWRARFTTYAWSYDFATLASYYGAYVRLMRTWKHLFPSAILDVSYAALVGEPTVTLRRVLDFCGLAWEPGCESLTRNAGPVSTLSAAAVRAPLHTRALGQWQRYAAQLEPLRRQLAVTG